MTDIVAKARYIFREKIPSNLHGRKRIVNDIIKRRPVRYIESFAPVIK